MLSQNRFTIYTHRSNGVFEGAASMGAVQRLGKRLHCRLMVGGRRYQMPVNRFAIPRMSAEERHLVASKTEAERVWLPRFHAEILAGQDPTRPPAVESVRPKSVQNFLD